MVGCKPITAGPLRETCDCLRIISPVDRVVSQQAQSWGIRSETYTKASANVLEPGTLNLSLPQFQNQAASRIVPVIILEVGGPITRGPIRKGMLHVAWFCISQHSALLD